jgi:hypothetical protein
MSMPPVVEGERGPSVCLIACYFGELPGWIHVFLLSCAHNPTIDFLIFTDQDEVPTAPSNVRFVRMQLSDFESFASAKLSKHIKLGTARKVCDFKPLYGLLFEDYLKEADYWGYTDLDVIYGDIRCFLRLLNLRKYDVFTARREYLVGHFTLFRNNDRIRRLFEQSVDIPAILQADRVFCFDECGEQCFQLLKGKRFNSGASCDSMTHVVHRLAEQGMITARFAPMVIEWPELRSRVWRLRWHRGKLWVVDANREYMYFHFHAFKKYAGYRRPRVHAGDDALEISAREITGCVVEHTVYAGPAS